jgi:hypothetical protein
VVFANFYGEDGSVYLQNVMNDGWLKGALTTFNGYFIIGLYLLCGLGWIINALFLGGSLLTLPEAFAAAAILFMAAVIALPYLLFSSSFGRTKTLLAVMTGALIPLPLSPHIVIGTIGNQKWIFLYLAFLLVLYRVINYKKLSLKRLIVIDVALLVAAYTNSTVYCLIPVAYLPYLRAYWTKRKKNKLIPFIKKELRQRDFQSLAVLSALLVPQVIYVALNGIPKLAGYLDTPFQPAKAIEVFINRTYLFGVTHIVNGHMNDIIAVILFLVMVFLGWKYTRGREKFAFFFGLYAAGMASILFVINRPGVSDHFHGYQPSGSGPDQFFYAQTLVMCLPILLVFFGVIDKFPRQLKGASLGAAIAFFIASGLMSNATTGALWRNASVYENDAGIFTDNALVSCETPDNPVRVTVYPYKGGQFSIYVPRGDVCNDKLNDYQPSSSDLGLKLNNNDHLPVWREYMFTQTFLATENGLEGIRLFLSNFDNNYRDGTYTLILMDENCKSQIRTALVPTQMMDNAYYNLRFAPITDSANKKYCFSLDQPDGTRDGTFDPIAIQRSQPNAYADGSYSEGETQLPVDVVFNLLYDQNKN